MRRELRLTKEQDAMRLAGLRILARLIVRAHLASLVEEGEEGRDGSALGDGPGGTLPADGGLAGMEGDHGR